ncbi:MAG: VWA domain-containing protein [Anaerolineales bacterium]|nr:VWA domain-containing protein [Anaerolineales bacterium]
MSTLHVKQSWLALWVVMLVLSGCAFGQTAALKEAEPAKTEVIIGAPEAAPPVDEAAASTEVTAGEEIGSAPPAEARVELYATTATPAPLPEADIASAAGESAVAAPQQTAPLRAGEVDDNVAWDDYLLYRRQYGGLPVHDRDVSERYIIEVKDGQGHPVLGASVRFLANGQTIYEAQTYANGQVLFHPLALNMPLEQVERFQVEVEKDGAQEDLSLTRFNSQVSTSFSERWTVTLDSQAQSDTLNLDVLFLVDATGSMADEINQIQSTIFDVAAQIDALPGRPQTRYGLVAYRDRGDAFVSQAYEFTPDVREFSLNLSTVYADGGGDNPESLNEGLHDALHKVEWRGGDTVQLIFLIADAPPHLDYPQDYDYAVEMDNAARRGIKIFPIASSGLDDQGEYIFRQLAQYTQGRFIFLTYAGPTNGGAPGEVTTHHVDDYSVANLDDLLVRLVEEELAYQNPRLAQAQ